MDLGLAPGFEGELVRYSMSLNFPITYSFIFDLAVGGFHKTLPPASYQTLILGNDSDIGCS